MEKISILVILNHTQENIIPCLNSLIKQSYVNKEIIVLHTGTKGEKKQISQWLQTTHHPISIYEQRNASLAALRNHGIFLATGQYILFVLPSEVYNHYGLETLFNQAKEANAELAIGSFLHSSYRGYQKDRVYTLSSIKDYNFLQHNILACSTLYGKLYKKELLTNLKFKNEVFQEEIFNLHYIQNAKKIATSEKIIMEVQDIKAQQNLPKERYWAQHLPMLDYRKKFYKKYKKELSNLAESEFIYFRVIDYLICDLILSAKNQPLENMAMEFYQIIQTDFFIEATHNLPRNGVEWKELEASSSLKNCLIFSNALIYQIPSILEMYPQISDFDLSYLLFIKLFFRQTGTMNLNDYLCTLREELNLNRTIEARCINQLEI
ncbi:MAG: glycosyltransferase [Anaeroplasmataceae bacterium]|nr:glycosyltransferase [Anaeroplasmataceae bacterium]